jgi:hypothetical protein
VIPGESSYRQNSGSTEPRFQKTSQRFKGEILYKYIFVTDKCINVIQDKWGIQGITVTHNNEKQHEEKQEYRGFVICPLHRSTAATIPYHSEKDKNFIHIKKYPRKTPGVFYEDM